MVKLVCFLKRKEGLTLDEFYDHWFNKHGPMLASTEPFKTLVKRYEQHKRSARRPSGWAPPGTTASPSSGSTPLADFEAFRAGTRVRDDRSRPMSRASSTPTPSCG